MFPLSGVSKMPDPLPEKRREIQTIIFSGKSAEEPRALECNICSVESRRAAADTTVSKDIQCSLNVFDCDVWTDSGTERSCWISWWKKCTYCAREVFRNFSCFVSFLPPLYWIVTFFDRPLIRLYFGKCRVVVGAGRTLITLPCYTGDF